VYRRIFVPHDAGIAVVTYEWMPLSKIIQEISGQLTEAFALVVKFSAVCKQLAESIWSPLSAVLSMWL
jgi:hypothetical protein